MKHTLLYIFIILLFIQVKTATSQNSNSMNISIIGCGNYSAKLSDYYSPKNAGMITIILRNNDLKEPVLPILLYMSVTNNLKTYIQTKSPNTSKIFQLYAGETLTLTGQDLECIFNTYYLNYKKPNFQDGQNILKIYARDTRTGKIVSNTAQILLKSVMIAPPKLTSPNDNFTIETDNQFINFTWRGDNGGANIATRCNYRYKFELWKQNINDKNVEAQRFADFTADNLFDEKYQFLLANFPFEIGQKYCWRVTAYDPFEKATFLQNGKSEVRSFIYKHLPVPVTGLKHTINERNRQATVTWNAAEGHTKYYIEYYNPQTTKTIAMEKDEPKFTLASAPEKEYTILFRVKAQCWGDDSRCSNWSDWDTIKYAAPQIVEPKYPCGYQFPKVEVTNFELKTDFKEGDIVSEANGSSDYEIINCKSDGDGVLQGQFYLIMNAWGGAKIACEFWDTKINTDNQIITTRYRSIDTPVGMVEPEELANYVKSLWLDGNSLATSSKIRDTIVIDQKFDYLYRRESGKFVAVVVNDDGSTTETEFDLHKNPSQTLITDGKGDSLVYSQNGQVMGIKEYRATGGNSALLKDYHRKSDSLAKWQINFLPYSEQTYAFDYLGSGNHGIYSGSEFYPYLNDNYDLRYKSVECYKTDKVIVDFGSYPKKDSVVFKDKYGVTLKLSKGNVLNFTGVAKPDTNYIYAYRGDEKIGKLSVNTYKKKSYKVVLVSVNKATLPDISSLQDSLNKFYKQSVVNFEVDTVNFYLPELLSFSHGGSPWNSVYNDDQKKVLSAYDKAKTMQDGVYYLFFIDNVTDKKDGDGTMVSGYMPRGYNCGFIYDGGSEHTIAHELGHGIAGLEHVFENSKSSGKTKNLMDYADGTQLWHFQWDQIQDPSRVWMKWNKDESEGESYFLNSIFYAALHSDESIKFYDNDIIYSTQNSSDTIVFGGINDKINDNIIGKIADLNCNIDTIFENNINISRIKLINTKKDFNDSQNTFTAEFKYDFSKIKWVLYSDNKIVKQQLNNFTLSDVEAGIYRLRLILSEGGVTLYIKYNDEEGKTKMTSLQLDSTFDHSFSLIIFKNKIVNIQPYNVENYYKNFGFDDAKNVENQKAGIYDKILMYDTEYYIPWLFVDDINIADLKLSLSDSQKLILDKRLKNKLYIQVQCSSCKINGAFQSSDIQLTEINKPINISFDQETDDTLNVYLVTKSQKEISGKLAMKCKKEKICGRIKLIIVVDVDNNVPNIDAIKALNLLNEYYKQANIHFEAATNLLDTIHLKDSVILNCSSAQKYYKSFDPETYHLFICNQNNGNNNGAGLPPSKNRNYGIAYVNFSDNYVTLAHEIGHCLGLPHTFESKDTNQMNYMESVKIKKYSTKNIMDYFENEDNRKYLFKNQMMFIYNKKDK